MSLQKIDSYTALHAFLTAVMSFLKKEQQFAGKDVQNIIFVSIKKQASLSDIVDNNDFSDALQSLYDLVAKLLYFRNAADDEKLRIFITSLVQCIATSKHISQEQAIGELISFVVSSFFVSISTDGIADLDPRGALLLLKSAGILPTTFKFSSPVGRGKISNHTTFDSGNTWLYVELADHPVLTYENIGIASSYLQQHTIDIQTLSDWQQRFLQSSRLVLDHHHRYCQSTSITHMMYTMIAALGKLPSDDMVLQRFVRFIDMSDDMYYQLATMDDRISTGSLMGIQRELLYKRLIDIDDIYNFFHYYPGATGLEILTDEQLNFLSHGKAPMCKQAIKAKIQDLYSGKTVFLALKNAHTFFHKQQPFLRLIRETIPRILDVTTTYGYGLLQLNQKTGEIKIHNVTGFDEEFLMSLTHPAIKVMKGRNIFIKANEIIPDDIIIAALLALGCSQSVVTEMIHERNTIIASKK